MHLNLKELTLRSSAQHYAVDTYRKETKQKRQLIIIYFFQRSNK